MCSFKYFKTPWNVKTKTEHFLATKSSIDDKFIHPIKKQVSIKNQ